MRVISMAFGLLVLATQAQSDSWDRANKYLNTKQVAFCNLIRKYELETLSALQSQNQIKQNAVEQRRSLDLLALLPDGEFEDWIAQVKQVGEVKSGDDYYATFDLNLNCRVRLSSGFDRPFFSHSLKVKRGGSIYQQLATLDADNFVMISGTIYHSCSDKNVCSKREFYSEIIDNEIVKDNSGISGNFDVRYFVDIEKLSKF